MGGPGERGGRFRGAPASLLLAALCAPPFTAPAFSCLPRRTLWRAPPAAHAPPPLSHPLSLTTTATATAAAAAAAGWSPVMYYGFFNVF